MAKIQFGGVHLDHEVDRLGGQGLAYANTSYFKSVENLTQQPHSPRLSNYSIELDTATALVTITAVSSGAAIVVPRERVKRFEPLPAPKAEDVTPAKK